MNLSINPKEKKTENCDNLQLEISKTFYLNLKNPFKF